MAGAAYAHAFLDRASPAVGSEVSPPPSRLTLTYTEPVEPLFSTVHVTDGSGAEVA
jgi:copper resistance protein C